MSLRLLGTAHDFRGWRQAVCRDCVRAERFGQGQACQNTPELKDQRQATVLYVFGL